MRSKSCCCSSVIFSLGRVTRMAACLGVILTKALGEAACPLVSKRPQNAPPWSVSRHILSDGSLARDARRCGSLPSSVDGDSRQIRSLSGEDEVGAFVPETVRAVA